MSIFNPPHFLRHIGMPTLQQFTQAHPIADFIQMDWTQDEDKLPAQLNQTIQTLIDQLPQHNIISPTGVSAAEALGLWHDDLRRCDQLANQYALEKFNESYADDESLIAFDALDDREKALWLFTFRSEAFRSIELYLSFLAKTNGKFWKKHAIAAGLDLVQDRERLEAFSHAVANLYQKTGAGKSTHVEVSQRDDGVQITLYVEGPVTAVAHFSQQNFKRMTTRIALETALVYDPATGIIETIVKGGKNNHQAVLKLLGEHIVHQTIHATEIEPKIYRLNALRDSMLPCEDWQVHGIDKARLKRATFAKSENGNIKFSVEASKDKDQEDATDYARAHLKIDYAFENEYNLVNATIMIYKTKLGKGSRFSFDVKNDGTSTIKNLSKENQKLAQIALKALKVIDD